MISLEVKKYSQVRKKEQARSATITRVGFQLNASPKEPFAFQVPTDQCTFACQRGVFNGKWNKDLRYTCVVTNI